MKEKEKEKKDVVSVRQTREKGHQTDTTPFFPFRGWRLPPHVRQCYAVMVARPETTTARGRQTGRATHPVQQATDRENTARATPDTSTPDHSTKPDKNNA